MRSKRGKIKLQLVSLSVDEVITNDDLLKQILMRVPTKPLIRFKSVSKQWLRLISDPQFAIKQSALNRCPTSALYFSELDKMEARGVQHISLQGHFNIPATSFLHDIAKGSVTTLVHSSHGLILCKHEFPGRTVLYGVCNFTTQKYASLPQIQTGDSDDFYNQVLVCLAFNPAKSPYYKVVLIKQYVTGSYLVNIFSSETASFKNLDVAATSGQTLPYVAFWDGAVHWMNDKKFHFKLDVDDERFTETLMPPKPKIRDQHHIRYFGECGGNLLLIQYRYYAPIIFRILEMKMGTCKWTEKHRVILDPVIQKYPYAFSYYCVLGVVEESHKSGLMLILLTREKLISYNLKFKKVCALADYDQEKFWYRNSKSYIQPFMESLFPVEFGPKILESLLS